MNKPSETALLQDWRVALAYAPDAWIFWSVAMCAAMLSAPFATLMLPPVIRTSNIY